MPETVAAASADASAEMRAAGGGAVGAAAGAAAVPRYPHLVRGIVCAAVGGTCWGFSGTCAQLLTSGYGVPVAWITCVRLLAAAAIFLAVCLVKDRRALAGVLRDGRSMARIAAFGLCGVLLTQMSYLSTISYTNAGTGTVLERLGLIVIMVYVCLRGRRWPRKREFAGLVLAMGGTFLIATKGNVGVLAIPPEALFWGGVSAFALAFYTLLPGKVLAKWGSLIVTGLAMLIAGTVATVFVQPWNIPIEPSFGLVGVMVAMVLVGTFAAYLFYLQGIKDAGPLRTGMVGCVEPVAATAISAVWLGTPVTPVDMLGVAMIVVMVLLVTQREEEGPAGGEAPAAEGRADEEGPADGKGPADGEGPLRFRPTRPDEVDAVMGILADGRAALAALGIDQWQGGYPHREVVEADVARGESAVAVAADGRLAATGMVGFGGEPDYDAIEGAWLTCSSSDAPTYAVVHRVAAAAANRQRGAASGLIGYAEGLARARGCASVRIDTHPGNGPMQRLLEKRGYTRCGIIRIAHAEEATPDRFAYEKLV